MRKKMDRWWKMLKKSDPVRNISILLMCLSFTWAPPGRQMLQFVDWRVIVILFCLMLVMEHLKEANVFEKGGEYLLSRVQDTRSLGMLLVLCSFLSAMFLTNDVALITFVPFTLLLLKSMEEPKILIDTVVLETAAANLGSQCTPIGNPQNLYLYYHFNLSFPIFMGHMIWPTIFSLFLCMVAARSLKKVTLKNHLKGGERIQVGQGILWILAFVFCVLSVLRLISYGYLLLGLVFLSLLSNVHAMKKVDYSILVTFICLFIFVHNLLEAKYIHSYLVPILQKNIYLSGILVSQGISNVPAAMLIAPLTEDWKSLLYGVNVGGLGTLIASMASVISYKIYVTQYPKQKRNYLYRFFIYNFILLVLLGTLLYRFLH